MNDSTMMVPTCCNTDGSSWFWLIILFLFFGFGGNGFGRGANSPDFQGYATRNDINEGFQFNQLENGNRSIERGICDLGYATQSGFNATQTAMLQGFNGVDRSLCHGFNSVESAIAENRFVAQNCCCETNRNIDAVRAENYRNTCEITNAIHNEAEATRALITQNSIQELRDQLQAAQLQLGNVAQTQTIINAVRPFPQPAYITCSPYMAMGNYGGCCNPCCG